MVIIGYSWQNILVLLCPSVCLSICPSVCPTSRICSVVPTVLVGSISYLYILSSNFTRCFACKIGCKIVKFEFCAIFFKFVTLNLTLDLKWITSMGNHGAVGVSQNAGVLAVLVNEIPRGYVYDIKYSPKMWFSNFYWNCLLFRVIHHDAYW